ncbi:hypothetical protein P879_06022 [Paragonimus westermani]|uniref:Nuclear pore protein n=1 Tax=Paragonimus westermani TaxID=34504 RepID=A0A8T0D479_9TREM|nr:hypothetical protein P879_06022 [Paragonimus westermani]
MDVAFDELVQDSEKLLMDVQGYTDLPYINRSLDQMRTFGDKLYFSRGPRSDVKAARLLGNKMSYELPGHLSAKLESLSTPGAVETIMPSPKLDIQAFLKTERENALLSVISMTQESLFENIENRTTRALRSWWEQEAAGVLSSLVGCSGPIDTDLLHQTISKDQLDSSTYVDGETGRTAGRTREELCYSKQLDRYISSQASHRTDFGFQPQTDRSKNLLLFFAEANGSSTSNVSGSSRGSVAHSDVVEIWNLFRRFGESMIENERNGATAHTPLELRTLPCVQRKLIECSLTHLESEFVQFMRTTVDSNPRLAKLGGRPGTRALVKAYLNLCLSSNSPDSNTAASFSMITEQDGIEFEDGVIDGKPLWPVIYCCLRAGDSRAAIEVARAASNSLENFPSVLEEYVSGGRRLSPTSQTRLRQNSLHILKVSRDPYKRLVFSILGLGATNENHSEVARSIDDFLWVKLSQVAASTSAASNWGSTEETLNLSQLQCLLYETYGEVHFDAWSQPLLYFKLLCLTQQFEGAIGFLARFEALRCHAIHLALALHHEKILLISDSIQSPLVCRNESDPIGFRRLNFARAIMLYTRKFEMDNPPEAVMYFHFLADLPTAKCLDSNTDEAGAQPGDTQPLNLFTTCVTELALATKEFDLLLGCVADSGVRKPGCIDRYSRTPDERQFVIAAVASALESRGHVMDAISLYQLAANSGHEQTRYYQKAVSLTNYLLAGLVATDNIVGLPQTSGPRAVGHPDRSLVIRIATKLAHRARQSEFPSFGPTVDEPASDLAFDGPSSLKTLFYLLDLATFFDLVQAEQWQAAVDHLDQLGLFPINPQFEQVESKVMLFTQLPDYVRRPLPAALITLMRCLVIISNRSRGAPLSPGSLLDDSSNLTLSTVRNRAKALIAYVGRIPYKLSGDVYARLTQMQMEIM